jgi:HSP20 family protein
MEEKIINELSSNWRVPEEPRFVIRTTFRQWVRRTSVWQPPTDVSVTEDAIIVRMEIAGMKDSEFTISLENRLLEIRGVRPPVDHTGAYLQMEVQSGEFISLVELPAAVDQDLVEATYDDGFLMLVLPKAKVKQVDVVDKT